MKSFPEVPMLAHRFTPLLLSVILALSSLLSPPQVAAQTGTVPTVLPFQALLTTQSGQLVPDGKYSVIFNLYAEAVRPSTGGQPLWSERHGGVGVSQGQINVFLGSQPADPGKTLADLDFSVVKYLGITIDTDDRSSTADPEMSPRFVIVPPWYALKSPQSNLLKGYGWGSFLTGANPTTATINGSRFTAGTITTTQLAGGAIRDNLADGQIDTLISSTATPVPAGYTRVGSAVLTGGTATVYFFKKN